MRPARWIASQFRPRPQHRCRQSRHQHIQVCICCMAALRARLLRQRSNRVSSIQRRARQVTVKRQPVQKALSSSLGLLFFAAAPSSSLGPPLFIFRHRNSGPRSRADAAHAALTKRRIVQPRQPVTLASECRPYGQSASGFSGFLLLSEPSVFGVVPLLPEVATTLSGRSFRTPAPFSSVTIAISSRSPGHRDNARRRRALQMLHGRNVAGGYCAPAAKCYLYRNGRRNPTR